MRGLSIGWFAFGYFACYAPYSALAKLLSKGQLDGMAAPIDGFVLLPSTVLASVVGMFTFLTVARWWRFATHRSLGRWSVPSPTARTLVSGTCTATIVVTTTLAYTFEGISRGDLDRLRHAAHARRRPGDRPHGRRAGAPACAVDLLGRARALALGPARRVRGEGRLHAL